MTTPARTICSAFVENDVEWIAVAAAGNGGFQFPFFGDRFGLGWRGRFNELDRVPAEKIAAGRALRNVS